MSLARFTRAYLEAALWASTDNADESGGEPLDRNYSIEDIAPIAREAADRECAAFYAAHAADFAGAHGEWSDDDLAGHDFWLTRNGHGTGFWDRDWYDDETRDRLSEAAAACGGRDPYVGDDGQIWGFGE